MDYTSIHINGHLLSDDILHSIETDNSMQGNREKDFNLDVSLPAKIDNAWSSLRGDWRLFEGRNLLKDPYGTRSVRRLMERFFSSLDYQLEFQSQHIEAAGRTFDIPYICPELGGMPVIIVGDKTGIQGDNRNTLDIRTKGERRQKSPHATMLDYLNSSEHIYGIVTNGRTLRLIRNTGQLVKLTYIEFDLRRMVEEDHYAEFYLLFRLMHASRFTHAGDDPSVMERWFNRSIESGNRIRAGLSDAVQRAMEILGQAAFSGNEDGNKKLRQAFIAGEVTAEKINKELIRFIYRLLFLFIIEDRKLVYQLPEHNAPDYGQVVKWQEIYSRFYAASRFRNLSELRYLHNDQYNDLWDGLMDTFRLFVDGDFGAKLGIKPLGGMLFNSDTLHWLSQCAITNDRLLAVFGALNEFTDENGNRVKISYSSLDVEEFGSVYEGILEMKAVVVPGTVPTGWKFGFGQGLDRRSSSSYYTRPDLVQSLIRTTLEPVIKEKIASADATEAKIKSLLDMKVCDAASGSGHIVLAMARTLAWYVCTLRTGEDNPASLDYREALREVIQKCVYAVDMNPDAVELCKVVLWIEGYCAGKPLSFLDAHVRCGNSVVGIANLDTLLDGVPKDAFSATDKDVKKKILDLNKIALKTVDLMRNGVSEASCFDIGFSFNKIKEEEISLAGSVRDIASLPEETLQERLNKKSHWEQLMESPRVECLRRACDIFTYAFYKQLSDEDDFNEIENLPQIPYTRTVYHALQEISSIDNPSVDYTPLSDDFKAEVAEVAAKQRFFHWCVEFPEVFANGGGFDVMCGNPPWDKIKVEDKKWFESHGRMDIVNAGTAAQRKKAIEKLKASDVVLYQDYVQAQADAEAMSRFVRFGGRFPLTATGDIDLYPMFAEVCLNFSKEAWGHVLPTGIAVNDSNKAFFSKLIDENRLISLYDFENREKLFDIDSRFKFCLLTAGKAQTKPREVKGAFYLTRLDHLLDPNRVYTLQTSDFALLNPNTKTCPTFRTSRDAELTAKIYRNCGHVIWNEHTGENPWGVKFGSMIHMSNDSHLFRTFAQLKEAGASLEGNRFIMPDGEVYVPLYEGKMIWHYNHHFGTWPTEGERPNTIDSPSLAELANPDSVIIPWYWVPENEVSIKVGTSFGDTKGGLMIYRGIGRSVDERTFICATVPDAEGVGNSATAIGGSTVPGLVLYGFLCSLPFDYAVRQKVGGINISTYFVKQFPILAPEDIHEATQWEMAKRVIELQYFNHDMDAWAEELWEEMTGQQRAEIPQVGRKEPFIFDPERRAVLQAELDAIVAHLFRLTTEDLRYILDPEDVCGPGCINETFRVLKEREIRELGEYRTRRLVLDAWHRFNFDN